MSGQFCPRQFGETMTFDEAVYNAVKEIADQKNYSVVVDRASAVSIVFATPSIDISNDVLAKLGYSD